MSKIRKIIQKTGFDFHRYRSQPDRTRLWKDLNIKTVLDIGANTGQFAKQIREQIPEAQIYSFEPLKDCFEILQKTFKKDSRFKAFNFALGEKEEELEIHKSEYSPSSSLLKMNEIHKKLFPHTKQHTEEKILVKRLDDISEEFVLKKEILIKVDVQGFEEKVILGGEKTFAIAKAVIMEVSFVELYENQPSFDIIYKKLKTLDFTYAGSLERKIDKHTAGIISEDSLFVKPN